MPTALPERSSLAALPTPVQPLERLGHVLGVDLLVKRDDLTGSHLSGNKIRKLDFLLAEAQAAGATTVITCGGLQSNHCRATALAAAALGMKPVVLLRTPNGARSDLPEPPTGNVLFDLLAGARIVTCTPTDYRERRGALMASIAAEAEAHGEVAYVVPEGGSNALGSLGYVHAARELLDQLDEPPDAVVVATGSGGTLAGLALGFEDLGVRTRAFGVAVCDDAPYFEAIVERIAAEARHAYGLPTLTPGRYRVIEGFQGRGYGMATDRELAFLVETLRRDGLMLDPVYTNKAFFALVHAIDVIAPDRPARVVFIHTGGVFGLAPFAADLALAAS